MLYGRYPRAQREDFLGPVSNTLGVLLVYISEVERGLTCNVGASQRLVI